MSEDRPTIGEMREKLSYWKRRAQAAEATLKLVRRLVVISSQSNASELRERIDEIASDVEDAFQFIDKTKAEESRQAAERPAG